MIIRSAVAGDRDAILAVVNDAAQAYRGLIPADCWHDPYMTPAELAAEIASGVGFRVASDGERLVGVMGIQDVDEVALVRHAYTVTAAQGRGIGSALLRDVRSLTARPLLIGTWAAAGRAIAFYCRHGFELVAAADKDRLLETYWSIPARQVETSVVLADARWFDARARRSDEPARGQP